MSDQWQQPTGPQAPLTAEQQAEWDEYHRQKQAYDQYKHAQRQHYAATGVQYAPDGDEKQWALFGHLSLLLAGFIGPLIIMLTKGNESPYIRHQSREALNFGVVWFLAIFVSTFVVTMLSFILIGFLFFPLIFVVAILYYVFPILAAIDSNKGRWYKYPVTPTLIN